MPDLNNNSISSENSFSHTLRHIAQQAWPVLIGQWATMLFGVLDTAMTGHASAIDLAAIALGTSIYITVFVGLMGVMHALIPILAQHFGAGQLLEVGRVCGQSFWLALALSTLGGIFLFFPDIWLSLSGQIDPQVRTTVSAYLRSVALSLPAGLIFRSIYALSTAVSRPKPIMLLNVGSIALKAFFNWIFIYGKLGFPAMGATGAGLASSLVSWMVLIIGVWIVLRDDFFKRFQLHISRLDWRTQKVILRLGIPMGASYLVEVCAFTFMALLVAREGTFVTGGHQIIANLVALSYMMPMSLGIATAALTAQAIGAERYAKAHRIGLAGFTLGLMGALLTSFILLLGRSFIISAYTNDIQVATIAGAVLQFLPIFHIFDSIQCINIYLLRAYKITVVPLLSQTAALAGVGLLGGWWMGFGPGRGSLNGLRDIFMAPAPEGISSLWLMACGGLIISSVLLHSWYWKIINDYKKLS